MVQGKQRDEGEGEHRACLTHISDRYPVLRIAEGGQLLELKALKEEEKEQRGGGKREDIRDFSANSRRRLQRKLATINEFECELPDFITLTYPGEYAPDWREWKRHLQNFNKAMLRKWPKAWGLWRLEFQKRGAPHFHFLVWDGPGMEGVQCMSSGKIKTISDPSSEHNKQVFRWMSETWYRIVSSGDRRHLAAGTRVEPIQSWNGVRAYASKYLAKLPEGNFVPVGYEGTGRFWGVIGKIRWKSSFFEQALPEPQWFKIRRILRKRLEAKARRFQNEGKPELAKRVNPWRMRIRGNERDCMSTFMDWRDSFRLLEWAWVETGGCPF